MSDVPGFWFFPEKGGSGWKHMHLGGPMESGYRVNADEVAGWIHVVEACEQLVLLCRHSVRPDAFENPEAAREIIQNAEQALAHSRVVPFDGDEPDADDEPVYDDPFDDEPVAYELPFQDALPDSAPIQDEPEPRRRRCLHCGTELASLVELDQGECFDCRMRAEEAACDAMRGDHL